MIKVGDIIPNLTLRRASASGPLEINTKDFFAGKRSILFAVPGAFTPVCSSKHLPGFLNHAQDLHQKDIQTIACLAVNDAFVLQAWAEQTDNKFLQAAAQGIVQLKRG